MLASPNLGLQMETVNRIAREILAHGSRWRTVLWEKHTVQQRWRDKKHQLSEDAAEGRGVGPAPRSLM